MSESYKRESRRDWYVSGAAENLTTAELSLGCFQRIADATELMAKRYSDLIAEKDRAEKSRDYWLKAAERLGRSNNALRGQITKLKKKAAASADVQINGSEGMR